MLFLNNLLQYLKVKTKIGLQKHEDFAVKLDRCYYHLSIIMKVLKVSVLFLLFLSMIGCGDQNDVSYAEIIHDKKLRKIHQELARQNPESIQPYVNNPKYWQYKETPILLLGATDQDNLFNHPYIWPFGLESHLDLMVKYGGNYVRNTMSSRDHGNLWPYKTIEDGLYDLNIWNDEYWHRFENFLRMSYERDIIVQIEIWDRFDYARSPWNDNPFNPVNNMNYEADSSGLPETIDSHPGQRENPFFRSVPELENNTIVLNYQHKYIEKILSITLDFPNVLYCISNETNESPSWSDYWAYFIRDRAHEKGVLVHITEMRDEWDLSHPHHQFVLNKPDLYTYVDFSQNNHQQGQAHWDNVQRVWKQYLEQFPRPMNSVKIYSGRHGGSFHEGVQKFWRNIFGGFATSRFHRTTDPFNPYGIGLSPLALTQIHSMRMLTDEMNVFSCSPSNHLLSDREQNEAYAFAEEGQQYAVYFPEGGSVRIDLSQSSGTFSMRWLQIMVGEWQEESLVEGGGHIDLSPQNDEPWVVLIKRK